MGIPSTQVLKLVSKEYHFKVFFEVDESQRSILYDLSQSILVKGKHWNIFQTFCQDCNSNECSFNHVIDTYVEKKIQIDVMRLRYFSLKETRRVKFNWCRTLD